MWQWLRTLFGQELKKSCPHELARIRDAEHKRARRAAKLRKTHA